MKRRTYIIATVVIVGALAGCYGLWQERKADTSARQAMSAKKVTKDTPHKIEQPKPFDKKQFSFDDAASPWVIVNKKRSLIPANYTPKTLTLPNIRLRSNITSDERQVTAVTAKALETLVGTAKEQGIGLTLESGYRSYNFQVSLYDRYVRQQGQAVADTQSARAGHSEHQTGFAADLGGITRPACNVEPCYADTPEGIWLAANAYKFGFIIRYPAGRDAVTGYMYEPWHLRYVSVELSTEMHNKNAQTLEEFFDLPAAPGYN